MIARVLASAILATAVLAAQEQEPSDPPAPAPLPESREQQPQTTSEPDPTETVNEPSEPDTASTDQSPADGNTPNGSEQSGSADGETSDQWWTDPPTLIGAVSATVSAVFAVVIFWVYRGQWNTMDQQARYMREGIDETRKAADAAKQSAETASTALHLLERADLHFEGVSMTPEVNPLHHNTSIKIHFKNFGRSRAERATMDIVLKVGAKEPQLPPMPEIVVAAGGAFSSSLSELGSWFDEPTINAISKGNLPMLLVTKVRYFDIFGKEHHGEYTARYYGPSHSGFILEGSSTD